MVPTSLTETELAEAAEILAKRDRRLRSIFVTHGPPPLWARRQGFNTLVQIILEQQVSLASAASMYRRLRSGIIPFTPQRFLELGVDELRALGLTRQKTTYCLHLATAVREKRINLRLLPRLADEEVKSELLKLKGIGSWSADVYLLMALLRPDVWPAGDLALAIALRDLHQLSETPKPEQVELFARKWRPYRSVAARMLWQHYLAQRALRTSR